jgi:hypothetical protein
MNCITWGFCATATCLSNRHRTATGRKCKGCGAHRKTVQELTRAALRFARVNYKGCNIAVALP